MHESEVSRMSAVATSRPAPTIHALAESHVPAILAACSDWEELARFGPPYWRPRSSAELQRKIAATAGPQLATEYTFVIATEDAGPDAAASDSTALPIGRLVGECSLHAIDWRNRHAQIGICIWRPADRHRGYGRAGIRFITNWAIDHLDLHRLEAWILEGNTASRRLFETLGFTHEATLTQRYRLNGGWRDVWVMGRVG